MRREVASRQRSVFRPLLFALSFGALQVCTLLLLSLPASAAPTLTPEQEARAVSIGENLRCPLCDTGESIAESRSDISVKMRSSVREQVAAGRSEREIYAFFAERYGNFVLLDPPKQGRNLLLWGAPMAALLGGGVLLWGFVRRRPGSGSELSPSPAPEEPFDPFLAQVQRDTRRGGPDAGGGA